MSTAQNMTLISMKRERLEFDQLQTSKIISKVVKKLLQSYRSKLSSAKLKLHQI
jgi:hypothetical protein